MSTSLNAPLAWAKLPPPAAHLAPVRFIPTESECIDIWNKVSMPVHIREHSELVAVFARAMGKTLQENGLALNVEALYASSLLHDIAKLHCLKNGGSHAQVGAAWVVELTGEPLLAQGVLFHVDWPWQIDLEKWPVPLLLQYADKRVMHNKLVTLKERFTDLYVRYGTNERARHFLALSEGQALEIERQLTTIYRIEVNASFTHSWRLV